MHTPDLSRNTTTAVWYALAFALMVCLLLIGLPRLRGRY
jgi:hypothetical protein